MIEEHPIHTVIVGAAGRDFHDFNQLYRDDPAYRVVAFTATQIPGISGRSYPTALAGAGYPDGIPIVEESELEAICRHHRVDRVHFAYSDVSYEEVMHTCSIALSCGADFFLSASQRTMVDAKIPVIATSAVRTGCGKSQLTRWLVKYLKRRGLSSVVVRHPMPYGNLSRQAVQRFATIGDLAAAECTVEEREEYEPHIAAGSVVYAGVDYAEIVAQASEEGDVLLWDGGNNDFPFVRPDFHMVLVDPLRPGSERGYHPGEAVLRSADVVVVAKTNAAASADIEAVSEAVTYLNPGATLVRGASPVELADPAAVRGKRVLVIEDGPTLTHGGMSYGAGYVAAIHGAAAVIVDPRRSATEEMLGVYRRYPHIGKVLPAVGYSPSQLRAIEQTAMDSEADVIVSGTPCDLAALVETDRPWIRATYEYSDVDDGLREALDAFLDTHRL